MSLKNSFSLAIFMMALVVPFESPFARSPDREGFASYEERFQKYEIMSFESSGESDDHIVRLSNGEKITISCNPKHSDRNGMFAWGGRYYSLRNFENCDYVKRSLYQIIVGQASLITTLYDSLTGRPAVVLELYPKGTLSTQNPAVSEVDRKPVVAESGGIYVGQATRKHACATESK